MTTQPTHTPTPLRVIDDNEDLMTLEDNYKIIASFTDDQGKLFPAATKNNRAFIVRAVNSHDEIVMALKRAHRESFHKFHGECLERCWLCQTLAKAEGK